MLNRSCDEPVNQFFVLTSCLHAEPSNLHVYSMPGFLRMMMALLACRLHRAVQPYSSLHDSARR